MITRLPLADHTRPVHDHEEGRRQDDHAGLLDFFRDLSDPPHGEQPLSYPNSVPCCQYRTPDPRASDTSRPCDGSVDEDAQRFVRPGCGGRLEARGGRPSSFRLSGWYWRSLAKARRVDEFIV